MECLFCVTEKRDMIEIFGELGKSLQVAEIISKYFWFEMDSDLIPSKRVCKPCWRKINNFHLFYCEVEECHKFPSKTKISKSKFDVKPGEFVVEFIKAEEVVCEIKEEIDSESDDRTFQEEEVSTHNKNLMSSTKRLSIKLIKIDLDSENKPILKNDELKKTEIKEPAKKKRKPDKRKRIRIRKGAGPIVHRIRSNQDNYKLIGEYFKMECDLCEAQFADWDEIQPHYNQQHQKKGYVFCTVCGQNFSDNRRKFAIDHIEFHKNPNIFQCNTCCLTFSNRNALTRHRVRHREPFVCHHCEKKFWDKQRLEQHLLTNHIAKSDRPVVCSECDNTRFVCQKDLESHIRLKHERVYQTICDVCARIFATDTSCREHKSRMHTHTMPKLQCPDCGNHIKAPNLKAHFKSCSQRKDKTGHICNICNKSKPTKLALQLHIKYIHEIKPLPCLLCGREYRSPLALKEHMASHTGVPLYTCPICKKEFNCKSNKYVHFKKKHEAEWLAARTQS